MKAFMDENFLLNNDTAVELYNNHAKNMPIFDYHCHLSPKEIAENKSYRNITEVWLGGDHYKWRAMRSNGLEEKYITGDAPDKEKFLKWAETVEQCIGNPLYHWTHLELKRFFGIDKILSSKTAEEIWEECNKLLATRDFTARALIERSNVKALCTTDDPVDNLEYHIALAKDPSFNVKVLPTWRPDKGVKIEKPDFKEWISKLEASAGVKIDSFEALKSAFVKRLDYFHDVGCRLSDHGMDKILYAESDDAEADVILKKALKGETLTDEEIAKYQTQVILFLGKNYAKRGWVMQIHANVFRNNSTRMFKILGPDTGYDAIADNKIGYALVKILDNLDYTNELPKTILYSLNPTDNELLGTIMGSFQGGGIPGKIQLGSGWWFNDQKDGMIKQMVALGNLGLLSRFVGMLTDSRSFLSYTRHEYFRRIMCNLIGEWVENGEYPKDMELLGNIVENICYKNAKEYFGINLE